MEIRPTRIYLLIFLLIIPFLVFSKNKTAPNERMPLTLVVLTLDASCFGTNTGNAVAQPSDGTPPYAYLWSNGDTLSTSSNLAAGNYSLTVTDADGASATEDFTIGQPILLEATVNATVGCDGGNSGSVSVTATGGVFPFNYAWSTGDSTQIADSLSTGNYFVTVTDFLGCETIASVNLNQPIAVNSNPSASMTSCIDANDANITLDVWGGSGGYTFLWSNDSTTQNISDLGIGTYTVTVTDTNGCTNESTTTIFSPAPINLNLEGLSNTSCFGSADGSALINAFGGSPDYTFVWNTGATGNFVDSLAAGTYTITITDSVGCTGTGNVNILEPQPLGVFLFTSPVCNGVDDGTATASVSGGTPPFNFLWSDGQVTQTASNLLPGTYSVTVTDAGVCTTEGSIAVNQNPTIFETNSIANIVSCPSGNDGMISVNPTGAIAPYSFEWSTGSTDSTITNLIAGTYTVTIYDFFNCTKIETFEITEPLPFLTNDSIVPSTCGLANGEITLNITGGNGSYTYEWFDGSTDSSISDLVEGNYSVNIMDANNCVEEFFFDVPTQNDAPTAIAQDLQITLDGDNVSITAAQIDNGSFDDCAIDSMYLDINNFDCGDLGETTVTLTVVDEQNVSSTATATVTISDITPPTVLTNDIQASLDDNGQFNITPMEINNGSFDNCAIDSMYLDVSSFDCSNIGDNTVTLTVVDASGLATTDTAIVTISEIDAPNVITQNIIVELDSMGMAQISAAQIDNGSTDNCGIDSMLIDITTFDCSNIGGNTVTLTVWDQMGLSAAGTATVTVVDSIGPNVITQNTTVYLNEMGIAQITVNDIDNGSVDNCGIDNLLISQSEFTCDDLGDMEITLTVSDISGNTNIGTATVTVLDSIAPELMCPTSISLSSCDSFIISDYMLPTVLDNCPTGMPSLVSGFAPGEILITGTETITYEYIDSSGNIGSCSFDLTLETAAAIDIQLDNIVQASDGNSDGSIFIEVTGGTAPYSFEWSDGIMIVGTDQDLTNVPASDYFVLVTDANGCIDSLDFMLTTGIQDPELVEKVEIYPNPTADVFWVKIDFPVEQNDRVQIYSNDGKVLLEKNLNVGEQIVGFNMNDYPNGVYTIQLTVDQGVVTKRLVLQN